MWEAIQANKRKSVVLIGLLAGVLVALGYFAGVAFDPQAGQFGILTAVGLWFILMAVALAGGKRILLATSGAREVTREQAPQLYNIVEEMKIASGLPAMPKVFIIDSDAPNAFAVGLRPENSAVAVTTGLLARLNRDELQGVIAHEIGHIANRDTLFMTLAGMTVGAIIILADVFLRGMWITGGSRRRSSRGGGQAAAIMAIVAVILAVLAPMLGQILYFACSRKREYLADASAAQFTRYPEGLASALEKIAGYHGTNMQVSKAVAPMFTVNPLAAAGSARSLFSTHPPTADRIQVLRAMAGGSLTAYDQAFRKLHGDQAILGARTLAGAPDVEVRPARVQKKVTQAEQLRAAKDILNQAARFATIACACGLRIKLPPGFDEKSVRCPRCGRYHTVPSPDLLAGAAALQTVRIVHTDDAADEQAHLHSGGAGR